MDCNHETIANGHCVECGVECQRFHDAETKIFTNGHSVPRESDRSIRKELQELPVPEEIKQQADRIYQELNIGLSRHKRRKQLIFFCLYNAYKQLNQPKDAYILAELLGLKSRDVTSSLTMFSETQTGYKNDNRNTTPQELAADYCSRIGLTGGDLEQVLRILDRLDRYDPNLSDDELPRKVLAGTITYFLTIRGIKYDKKVLAQQMLFSEATLKKVMQRVAAADNH